MDGTLLDTSRDICAVLNASLKKFHLPQVSLEQTVAMVGNGAKTLVERAACGQDAALVGRVYQDYSVRFAACGNELTALYGGEESALMQFKAAGLKLAIVTNKPQRATERVYDTYLSRFGFDIVLGQSDAFPLKPDPASTLYVMERLGVGREECLFIGDGETDVKTAAAAGVRCASALWGFRSRSQLEEAGATLFFSGYGGLAKYVLGT